MIKICFLRSGSSGNCTLLSCEGVNILIDAGGQSQIGLSRILAEVNLEISDIAAVVNTHLHGDHINKSAVKLLGKQGIPLWIHEKNKVPFSGYHTQSDVDRLPLHTYSYSPFEIGTVQFEPFGVSHDARGTTCGFRISAVGDDSAFISYAADLGIIPDRVLEYFYNAQIIYLEANYNDELLWANPRRIYSHKKRVSGRRGHLSNVQAGEALVKIHDGSHTAPVNVILGHLSDDHNSPELALETVQSILEKNKVKLALSIAFRKKKTEFFTLKPNGKKNVSTATIEQLTLF